MVAGVVNIAIKPKRKKESLGEPKKEIYRTNSSNKTI